MQVMTGAIRRSSQSFGQDAWESPSESNTNGNHHLWLLEFCPGLLKQPAQWVRHNLKRLVDMQQAVSKWFLNNFAIGRLRP